MHKPGFFHLSLFWVAVVVCDVEYADLEIGRV